jgi:hypothetical protein
VAKISPLENLRHETAYGSARFILGLPFLFSGCLAIFSALCYLVSGFNSGWQYFLISLVPVAISLLAAAFFFSVSALASAIFDIADAAVRRHAMDKHREAKEAYQAYQASQDLG